MAGLRHGRPSALQPRVAVTGQHQTRLQVDEAVQRGVRLLGVGRSGGRDQPRSTQAGVGVEGDQRVAADQDVALGQVEHRLAPRMPGGVYGPRPARHCDDLVIAVRLVGVDPAYGQRAGCGHGAEDGPGSPMAEREGDPVLLRSVPVGVRGQPPIVRMHPHRHPQGLVQPTGEPDVVEVPVGEQQGLDVGGLSPDGGQAVDHRLARRREARVDERDALVVSDHVAVRVCVLDAVHAGRQVEFDSHDAEVVPVLGPANSHSAAVTPDSAAVAGAAKSGQLSRGAEGEQDCTMARYCLLGHIDPDRIEEYREAHRAVWPELLRELQDAGWRNYSLFLRDDGLLIGYVESDDLDAAQERVARTEVNARWQAAMASLFGTEGAPDEAWQRIPEVFNLEDQLARLG